MPEMMHVMTSAGRLVVRLSRGARAPLMLIHGNSMSSSGFCELMQGPLGRSYRMIAVDLPGHGASQDAACPERTYTLPGYADAMLDVLVALDARDATLCGWSLGGHIALEMMARSTALRGAFTIAAPPVTPGPGAILGFNVSDSFALFGTQDLSPADKRRLAICSMGAAPPAFALADIERADGRARRILVESILGGMGADPMKVIADESRMIGLVVGEREELTSWDFMRTVTGPALWRGGALRIRGAGHAPFRDAPEEFNPLLLQFIRDADRRARAPLSGGETVERRLTA